MTVKGNDGNQTEASEACASEFLECRNTAPPHYNKENVLHPAPGGGRFSLRKNAYQRATNIGDNKLRMSFL